MIVAYIYTTLIFLRSKTLPVQIRVVNTFLTRIVLFLYCPTQQGLFKAGGDFLDHQISETADVEGSTRAPAKESATSSPVGSAGPSDTDDSDAVIML